MAYLPVKYLVVASHLTNDLQAELKNIGSGVILETEGDSDIKIRFNSKARARGGLDSRSICASAVVELPEKHLQLEEKEIAAGDITIHSIPEMAMLIDKWLVQRCDIFDLAKEYTGIRIFDKYKNLRTLSNQELLELRWEKMLARIRKGQIRFREDVLNAFRANFAGFFPSFSHEYLTFSDVIYSYSTFDTPFVFCDEDLIEVGFDFGKSKDNRNLKTSSIQEAIEYTRQLVPAGVKAINPLAIPSKNTNI